MSAVRVAPTVLSALLALSCGKDEPLDPSRGRIVEPPPGYGGSGGRGQGGAPFGGTSPGGSSPAGGSSAAGTSAGGSSAGAGGEAGQSALDFQELALPVEPDFVTDLVFLPDGSLLLSELSGQVFHLEIGADDRVTELGRFNIDAYVEPDCGLISLAPAPDFATSRQLFLGKCTDADHSGIFRVTLEAGSYDDVAASEVEILLVGDPAAPRPWHNVGSLAFDDDGYLYTSFGDKNLDQPALDPNRLLGKLVRIAPSQEPGVGGYESHPENAFAQGEGRPEIYALGFRSPWKTVRDAHGHFWVGDVGTNDIEELNLVTAAGQSFGWPISEGPCDGAACDGQRDPITHWTRSLEHPYVQDDPDPNPESHRTIWVGPAEPEGQSDPYSGAFDGCVLFGEFYLGFVRRACADANGSLVVDEHVGHLPFVISTRRGPGGYLYAATLWTAREPPGRLYRAVPR